MKKQFWLFIAAAMLAAALGGCGGQEDVSEPASEPTSPVSSESTPEEASGTAASDPEPAGDTPVGEFWSIPDETPSDQILDLFPDFDLMSIPPLRPETAAEGDTVGKIKAWWQSLSPDDPLLDGGLTMTPEEKVIETVHDVPTLTALGEPQEDPETGLSVSVTSLKSDGYLTICELSFSDHFDGYLELDSTWDDRSPGPASRPGGGSFGALTDDNTLTFSYFAAFPYVQLSQRFMTPFAFDIDLRLEDYLIDSRTAVFPRVDNTREGLAPVAAQLSSLSFVIDFAMIGVPVPESVADLAPIKLLDGDEVVYTIPGDGAGWNCNLYSAGPTYVPVVKETATVAGEYDWRQVSACIVYSEDHAEIFPDYDRIDAIEFEGVVYPLQ